MTEHQQIDSSCVCFLCVRGVTLYNSRYSHEMVRPAARNDVGCSHTLQRQLLLIANKQMTVTLLVFYNSVPTVYLELLYRRFRRRLADVDFFFGVVGVTPPGEVKPNPPGAGVGDSLVPNVEEVALPNNDGAGGGPVAGAGVDNDPLNENADDAVLEEEDAGAEEEEEEKALGAGAAEENPKLDVDGAGALEDDVGAGAEL